jgi:DNA-directed RNA polymerase specialized sigma24 family protein
VNPLTCQAAVHAASDQLAGLLSDAERGALEDHLAGCDSCSCLMDQLRSTVAVLGSRPEVQVPDSLRAMVAHTEGDRAEALIAQLPHLYALANALDANAADDLVQETLTSALADPDTDTTGSVLAAALERLAAERGPDVDSPAVPTAGSDPDADEAELFYPDFYTDGPDAGAWVDSPVAWGEARVLRPDDALVTTEAYGAVDAALAELVRSTSVSSPSSTSKGRHSARPFSSSTCPPARRATASPEPGSRSAPRSTGTSRADALAAAPAPWQTLTINLGSGRRIGSLGRVR